MVGTKNSCDDGQLPCSSSSGAGQMQIIGIVLIMEENTWRDMMMKVAMKKDDLGS